MKLLLMLLVVLGLFNTVGCMQSKIDGAQDGLCDLTAVTLQLLALTDDDDSTLETEEKVEEASDKEDKATQTKAIDIHNPTLFFARPQQIHYIVWYCLFDVRAQCDLARYLNENRPVNLVDGKGSTPLHVAAWMGDACGVDWLLRSGADARIRNHEWLTAKEMAELRGHNHVIAVFERFGA